MSPLPPRGPSDAHSRCRPRAAHRGPGAILSSSHLSTYLVPTKAPRGMARLSTGPRSAPRLGPGPTNGVTKLQHHLRLDRACPRGSNSCSGGPAREAPGPAGQVSGWGEHSGRTPPLHVPQRALARPESRQTRESRARDTVDKPLGHQASVLPRGNPALSTARTLRQCFLRACAGGCSEKQPRRQCCPCKGLETYL